MPQRENYTNLCFQSLLAQNFNQKFEILLVQHPGYYYEIPFLCPENITITQINSGENLSSKRNDILKYAKGKYILFIDDDAVAESNWLTNMIIAAETYNSDIFWGSIKPIYEKQLPESLYPFEMYIGGFHYDRNGKLRRTGLIGCNFGIRKDLGHARGCFVEALGRGSEIRGGEEILFLKEYTDKKVRFIENAIVFHYIQSHRITYKYILYNQFNNVLSQVFINKMVNESNKTLGLDIMSSFIRSIIPQKNYLGNLILSFTKLMGYLKGIMKYAAFTDR